ncbi:oligosaccharide flippase family protein [Candidatus Magnetominusculus xianensis]|uniref:Polysaccharide biosynthesis protein n=1 Tax=Candidatus Magnetominusculus xianensis TaxID=1748249 RepID=A0ABR5SI63_9BACT|nr:oligosaccharide flippase family protein [Candidatus Magnetominusculus xianensis]KWT90943.1 polysaccharide biosynthesis protein [Candidatus Magnetominusculus xianensis]MBF0403099.1 oligosaccharide flippase family protein [Nitrospirota bacterium]
MDQTKRIKKIASNTAWFITSRMAEVINSLLLVAIVARYLGVKEFGVYSFLIAACWTVLPLFLVLQRILVRDIAIDKGQAPEITGEGLALIGLLAPPILVFTMVLLVIFKVDAIYFPALAINVFAITFAALNSVCTSVFIAFEKVKYETLVSFVISFLSVVFMAAVVFFDMGFNAAFLAFMLSNLIGLCISWGLAARLGARPVIKFDKGRMIYFIKECGFLAVNQILIQVYSYLGVFFLKTFTTDYDIGLFQAPARVVNRLNVFPISFSVALYPVLASLTAISYQKEQIDQMITTACRLTLIVTIPLSIAGFVMAEELVMLFFGAKYVGSAALLRLMILGINFSFLIYIFEPLLIILHKQRNMFILNLILLTLSGALYYPLTKFSGAYGASAAFFASNVLYLGIYLYYMSSIVSLAPLFRRGYLAIAGGGIALGLIYFSAGRYPKFMVLAAALAIYGVFAKKAFTFGEILFMKGLLRKKPAS